jgi:hypothetical protein
VRDVPINLDRKDEAIARFSRLHPEVEELLRYEASLPAICEKSGRAIMFGRKFQQIQSTGKADKREAKIIDLRNNRQD